MSDEESDEEWLMWISKSEAENPEFIKWVRENGEEYDRDLWWDMYEVDTELAFLDEQIDDTISLLKQKGPDVIAFIENTHTTPKDVAPEKDACANGGGVIWAFKQVFGRLGLTYGNIMRNSYTYGREWKYEVYELAITLLSEVIVVEVYLERDYIDYHNIFEEATGKTRFEHVEEKLRSTLYLKSLITLLASTAKKLVDKATRRALEDRKREREEERQERRLKRKVDLRFH
jgi:hypothetical protein